MTVADLYLSLVLIGLCGAAGALVYKHYRDMEERLEMIERVNGAIYHRLPPASEDDLLGTIKREAASAART